MKKYIFISIFLVLILNIVANVVNADHFKYKVINGVRVIEDQIFTRRVAIEGAKWDGAIIRNNIFMNTKDEALDIRDTRNLLIENNEFAGVKNFAILLPALKVQKWGTDNITIKGNYFHDTGYAAIHTVEPNKNVKIVNNTFKNIAMDPKNPTHAMYLKGPDFLVEGNTIDGVGKIGISLRSSGVVRGNRVANAGLFGIGYWANSNDTGKGVIIIENNVIVNSKKHDINFGGDRPYPKIDRAIVRFNTLVHNKKSSIYKKGIYIDENLEKSDFQIYGNIIINSEKNYFHYRTKPLVDIDITNLTSTSDIGFVDFAKEDFRLTLKSSARDFVSGIPATPPYDVLKNPMGDEPFDAGAYQYRPN